MGEDMKATCDDAASAIAQKEADRIREDAEYTYKAAYNMASFWRKVHFSCLLPSIVFAVAGSILSLSNHPLWGSSAAFASALSSSFLWALKPIEKSEKLRNIAVGFHCLRNDLGVFIRLESNMKTDAFGILTRIEEFNKRRNRLLSSLPLLNEKSFQKARQGIELGETSYTADRTEQ